MHCGNGFDAGFKYKYLFEPLRCLLVSVGAEMQRRVTATADNIWFPAGRTGAGWRGRSSSRRASRNRSRIDLAALVEPLLVVRRVLREQLGILSRRLLAIVRDDEVCRRLMTVPGVGPVVALTYRATVDVSARFRNSKAVGAVFGLTSAQHQSS